MPRLRRLGISGIGCVENFLYGYVNLGSVRTEGSLLFQLRFQANPVAVVASWRPLREMVFYLLTPLGTGAVIVVA